MLDQTSNQNSLNLWAGELLDEQLVKHLNFTLSEINVIYPQHHISLWFQVKNQEFLHWYQIIDEEGSISKLNISSQNSRLYLGKSNQQENDWSGSYLSTDVITSPTWHQVPLFLEGEAKLENFEIKAFTTYVPGIKIDKSEEVQLESHAEKIKLGELISTTRFEENQDHPTRTSCLSESIENIQKNKGILTAAASSFLSNLNHEPVAIDDTTRTVENTEVILLSSRLLANDTDLDGDSLTLTTVGNATNGTVTKDEQGHAIFTPELNFSGDASFEYTVSDGQGGTTTATVTVTVLPQTSPIPLGTNLHRLADWSPQLPFLDAFKSSRPWITQNWGVTHNEEGQYEYVWNTEESAQLDLDEKGWLKSLPAPEDDPEYTSVGTLMFRDVGNYPGGKYVVLYDGEGSIEYALDGQKDEFASTPGRDVIEVTPSSAGIWLRITSTDPNDTGDYLRNIRVLPEEYEDADAQIFNPVFLEKIQPFQALRFMDWMATNNSNQGEWSQRPVPDSSLFSGEMASLEIMVELANQTDAAPWFTLPHRATDEYVTKFAQYVKDNLDPDLQVYVEYSNEVWNSQFAQGSWIEEQGQKEWFDSPQSDYTKE